MKTFFKKNPFKKIDNYQCRKLLLASLIVLRHPKIRTYLKRQSTVVCSPRQLVVVSDLDLHIHKRKIERKSLTTIKCRILSIYLFFLGFFFPSYDT